METENKTENKKEPDKNDRLFILTYYEKERLRAIRKFPDCVPQHNFPDCPNTIEEMEREDIDMCVKCPYGGRHLKRLYSCLIIKQPDKPDSKDPDDTPNTYNKEPKEEPK